MGDIADDIYNQMADGYLDDYGDDEWPAGPRYSPYGNCRRCGAPIEFVHTGVRWRLYERGAARLHTCATAADPSEFEVLDD